MELLIGLIAVISMGIGIFCLWSNRALSRRLDQALGGNSQDSLENTLGKYFGVVKDTTGRLERLIGAHEQLAALVSMASQKISIVRFNPFGDTGGDQSFSIAVLDGHNSGYVLTSIHGRQGTRSYIKPVDFGRSKYSLSEEEKQAISQAMRRTPEAENVE